MSIAVKSPPTQMGPPLAVSDSTVAASFDNVQEVGAPVAASTAATRVREMPPTVRNSPPTNTVLPLTAIVCTLKLAFGFHDVNAPEASNAARRLRVMPPMLVNRP